MLIFLLTFPLLWCRTIENFREIAIFAVRSVAEIISLTNFIKYAEKNHCIIFSIQFGIHHNNRRHVFFILLHNVAKTYYGSILTRH
jgi:hypothetical protein